MSAAAISVPPLRHGDRLSPAEFEHRYEAMPDVKAELLNGVVYMASPVTAEHGIPHCDLMTWLGVYKANTPGVEAADNVTIRLPLGNIPQPDVYLRIKESHGGTSRIDAKGYVAGVPELLGEIARSSLDYDRDVKLPLYRAAGVSEFILWRSDDHEVDWYRLDQNEYRKLPIDADGIIRSKAFPGLWLNVQALTSFNQPVVLGALGQGIASTEHAQFVADLRKATGS